MKEPYPYRTGSRREPGSHPNVRPTTYRRIPRPSFRDGFRRFSRCGAGRSNPRSATTGNPSGTPTSPGSVTDNITHPRCHEVKCCASIWTD